MSEETEKKSRFGENLSEIDIYDINFNHEDLTGVKDIYIFDINKGFYRLIRRGKKGFRDLVRNDLDEASGFEGSLVKTQITGNMLALIASREGCLYQEAGSLLRKWSREKNDLFLFLAQRYRGSIISELRDINKRYLDPQTQVGLVGVLETDEEIEVAAEYFKSEIVKVDLRALDYTGLRKLREKTEIVRRFSANGNYLILLNDVARSWQAELWQERVLGILGIEDCFQKVVERRVPGFCGKMDTLKIIKNRLVEAGVYLSNIPDEEGVRITVVGVDEPERAAIHSLDMNYLGE